MGIVEDIREFREDPYVGLHAVGAQFINYNNVNFYGADRIWTGMIDKIDGIIQRNYRIWPDRTFTHPQEVPFLFHFRQTFAAALKQKPKDMESCKRSVADMSSTLEAVTQLDRITPFLRNEQLPDPVVPQLREGVVSQRHIDMIDAGGKRFVSEWNDRGGKRNGRNASAWDQKTYLQTLLGRMDIVARRLYSTAEKRIAGHFILRDGDGYGMPDTLELIDIAAEKAPGVADVLATSMIRALQQHRHKRIVNVVENYH